MNLDLTPEQEEIRAAARRFVEAEVLPHAADWDRSGALPRGMVHRMGEEGFLGGPLPEELGGRGWSNLSMALVYEELGAGDQSLRGFLSVQLGLVAQCLLDHGSQAQKEAWLPGLASGEKIGAYALTEEGAGSDVAAMQTLAVRDGDGWRLSGRKVWITNGGIADVLLVFTKTDPDARHKGITAFVVPADREGIDRRETEGALLGHRASDHATVTLGQVPVGPGDVLGEVGGGFGVAMSALDHGRLGVAAGGVGTARACLAAAMEHCRARRQFGRRIGDFQMVQERLADMAADTEAARLLTWKAAWLADRAEGGDEEAAEGLSRAVSMAKWRATDAAQRAAESALLLLASRGYSDRSAVERHYRDIPGLRIYEGTNLIQRIVVARDLLGPDATKPRGEEE